MLTPGTLVPACPAPGLHPRPRPAPIAHLRLAPLAPVVVPAERAPDSLLMHWVGTTLAWLRARREDDAAAASAKGAAPFVEAAEGRLLCVGCEFWGMS